jgi:hypothetical protein
MHYLKIQFENNNRWVIEYLIHNTQGHMRPVANVLDTTKLYFKAHMWAIGPNSESLNNHLKVLLHRALKD